MRRMARPRRQTDRPASIPAIARVRTRATFDAKLVATTMPDCSETKRRISGPTVDSDRPSCALNTLVESQTSARTPSLETALQRSRSNGSPTPGA